MTELDPKLTFDSFVVGPANRLATAAARRTAESPGTAYNPLFIYSASGLGKSHIMHAMAQHAQVGHPSAKVRYQTTEGYLDELAKALSQGSRDALRSEYQSLDILLLDDVQFLTGHSEAQEMLLRALDAMTGEGKQIILASDRPPADINGLDERLVSRFSGGLLVDIAQPEYETRVAIVRRKAEQRGATLEKGVAEAIARFPFLNVRELQGGLNKILAIQELEEAQVTADEARAILGPVDGLGDVAGGEQGESGAAEGESAADAWRRSLRAVAEEFESKGYSAARLRKLAEGEQRPEDLAGLEARYRAQVARLEEIKNQLHAVGEPWAGPAGLLEDPDRLEEAEALLAAASERKRGFPALGEGPDLDDVAELFPALAVKAAKQLIDGGSPDYNPVVLVSPDGPYTFHLMEAAGRSLLKNSPEATVALVSVPEFAEDFIRALGEGVVGAWRERWWTVDLLMVSDCQEFAATERAQNEFFQLFEAISARGARIFLSCDRRPSALEGIDDRLRSRFEAGLVVDAEESPEGFTPPVRSEPEEVGHAPGDALIQALDEVIDLSFGGALIPALERRPEGDGDVGGLFSEEVSNATAVENRLPKEGRRWFPSPETVVWEWPDLDELLAEVED